MKVNYISGNWSKIRWGVRINQMHLARSMAHMRSQRSTSSRPDARTDPFSLPFTHRRWPNPLQWRTPWRRWVWRSSILPDTAATLQREHVEAICATGSWQLGQTLPHKSWAVIFVVVIVDDGDDWSWSCSSFVLAVANPSGRSPISGAGIMKWYRRFEIKWWLHPIKSSHHDPTVMEFKQNYKTILMFFETTLNLS